MVKKIVCLLLLPGLLLSSAWGLVEITAEDVRSGAIWKLTPEVVKAGIGSVTGSSTRPIRFAYMECPGVKLEGEPVMQSKWRWRVLDTQEWYNEVQNWYRYWSPPVDSTKEQMDGWGKNLRQMHPRVISALLYSERQEREIREVVFRKKFQSFVNSWSKGLGTKGKSSVSKSLTPKVYMAKYYQWIAEGESFAVCISAMVNKGLWGAREADAHTPVYDSGKIYIILAPNMKLLNEILYEISCDSRSKEGMAAENMKEITGEHSFETMVRDGSIWKVSPDTFAKVLLVKTRMQYVDYIPIEKMKIALPRSEGRRNIFVTGYRGEEYLRSVPLFRLGKVNLDHAVFYWSPENDAWSEMWSRGVRDSRTENMRLRRISSLLFRDASKASAKHRVDELVRNINKYSDVEGVKKTAKTGKRTEVTCTWQFKGSVARLEAMYEDKANSSYAVLTLASDAESLDFQRDKTDISKTLQAIIEDAAPSVKIPPSP